MKVLPDDFLVLYRLSIVWAHLTVREGSFGNKFARDKLPDARPTFIQLIPTFIQLKPKNLLFGRTTPPCDVSCA
jgi:hypothetical protein